MRRAALLAAAILGLGFPAGLGLAVYLASGSSLAPPATARVPAGEIARPSTLPPPTLPFGTTTDETATDRMTTEETTTDETQTTRDDSSGQGRGRGRGRGRGGDD